MESRGIRRARSVTALLALVVFAPSAAWAEDSFAYDLAGELMSPFCPGRTVASCPSPQASEMIQWIQIQEAAGATRDEIVEILVARHGEEILGAPPAEGITLWAYVFPVAGFLGGGGVAAIVLRRIVGGRDDDDDDESSAPSSAQSATASSTPTSTDDDELARLVDEELSNRR